MSETPHPAPQMKITRTITTVEITTIVLGITMNIDTALAEEPASEEAKSPPQFMTLPKEIRHMVYAELTSNCDIIAIAIFRDSGETRNRPRCNEDLLASLLVSCHKLRDEITTWFRGAPDFEWLRWAGVFHKESTTFSMEHMKEDDNYHGAALWIL